MFIIYPDFEKIEMRVGKIVAVDEFVKAKKPAYKLKVDFGEFGIKKSSAQITANYKKEELLDRLVIGVVNFPPKQIADFISEVLILGTNDENGNVVLLKPDQHVLLGSRIY